MLFNHKEEEHRHIEEERKLASVAGLHWESGEKLGNYLLYVPNWKRQKEKKNTASKTKRWGGKQQLRVKKKLDKKKLEGDSNI